MDVIPNIGAGSVRFGMKPSEVMAHFPEEQLYEDWMGGNLNDSLLYRGIIFGFDKYNSVGSLANSRLVEIRMYGREDAVICGRLIGTWKKETIINYWDENDLAYEDHDNGDVSIPSLSLVLSFDSQDQIEYLEMWESVENRP
jgi:hypothetical protein